MTTVLSWAALFAWIALATLRGQFWRVRLPAAAPSPPRWPSLVAIVPARDEAEVIATSLSSLLRQDYPGDFHVIVVDDHSNDGTAHCALETADRVGLPSRLTVLAARPLPEGWTGKVWAQSEGMRIQHQRFPDARYIWLTDADIEHGAATLRELVARAEAEQRVLTSLMVRLRCVALAERACMPAFVWFFALLYPFALVNDTRSRIAAAAGGCMLVRSVALAAIGGIASIKAALIDDCALAARLKRIGPIRLDLATSSHSLRSCERWRDIGNMIARSAYTQLAYSPALLLATLAGMLFLFAVPPAFAVREPTALAAWLLMMCLYAPTLRHYNRSLLWAPALPLVALFYLGATVASAWRFYRGKGGQWKGRAQALQSR